MRKIMSALTALILLVPFHSAAEDKIYRYARIQALRDHSVGNDIYDANVSSPKSALFSLDGRKIYINALEGNQTLVYSFPDLKPMQVIDHKFNENNDDLFLNGETTVFGYQYLTGQNNRLNTFEGKPVEMALSHQGRYLWITYYRRSFDANATSPSAVAIVDTVSDKVVRVMPTGPLPKFVSISKNSKYAAITHWGDNTIGLIDISSQNPNDFKYVSHLVVERKQDLHGVSGDRDNNCGYCLRGTVFTPDGNTILVARMGGGGVAGFDITTNRYLGTVKNVVANPRHLVLDEASNYLYVSGNQSGLVGRYDLKGITNALYEANGGLVDGPAGSTLPVGKGARTIVMSPNKDKLYVAVNDEKKLVQIDLRKWSVGYSADVDPFPVGLAISQDGKTVVTTSQGKKNMGGGQSVGFYKVQD